MIYPNSSPEFRLLVTGNGESKLQIRYVCSAQGYTSKWTDVPIVIQNDL
jgi:hypothetical protein